MLTLGDRIAARDDGAFVGREREVAALQAMFSDGATATVAYVHGPGGVGKSALLRAVARHGRERGWTTVAIEGRDVAVDRAALSEALAPAHEAERPLVLLDTYERLTPLDRVLRGDLLPALPARSVVVLASRQRPDPGWSQGGWEHVARTFELDELPAEQARSLLTARGVDQTTAQRIQRWAGGSPLALTLAAETSDWSAGTGLQQPELLRRLVDRLVDEERDPVRRRALETAAVARVTTPGLLAVTLDVGDAAEAYAWLASRAFAAPLGDGIALHDLTRKALRADLRRRDPSGERDLTRRVIDHLYAHALRDDLELSLDLGDLTDDADIRAGWVPDQALAAYVSAVGPAEVDALVPAVAARHGAEYAEALRVVVAAAPSRAAVVQDPAGGVRGVCVSMTAANAPAAAHDDPLLGPWLAHAAAERVEASSILIRDVIDLSAEPGSLQALVNVTAFTRAGLANPRYCYSAALAEDHQQQAFLQALGATRLAELDAVVGGVTWEAWRLDYGPDGFLDFQRADLYRQLGLQPPPSLAVVAVTASLATDVRDAFRHWRRPDRLAASPLATGTGTTARAQSVQDALRGAIIAGFGDAEEDRALRATLEAGYLEGRGRSHEAVADALYLSRANYFRRLRTAVERVALTLARDRGA